MIEVATTPPANLCPVCGNAVTRVPWSTARRLKAQPKTLATVLLSTSGTVLSQAHLLPHPWEHVAIIVFLVVAVVAAARMNV